MILKGKKVILRYPELKDAKWLFTNVTRPEITKMLAYWIDDLKTLKQEIAWIKSQPKKRKIGHYNFTIVEKKTGKLVGSCGTGDPNVIEKRNTMGWWIAKEYWGKGYALEAVSLLIDFCFKKLKLNRLEAEIFTYNERSFNFAKKLGFKLEGIGREKAFKRGKLIDTYDVSLLKREWKPK